MVSLEKNFFIIGSGIGSPARTLSLTVIDILKSVDEVFFEAYTNFTASAIIEYENYLNRKITPLYRKSLENNSKPFLINQKDKNIALLVSGDPFIATTHYLFFLEAIQLGLNVKIFNNVSIYSLIPSLLGLSSYKFGKTATIPFKHRILSEVPYYTLEGNLKLDTHTVLLLDINLIENKFLPLNEAINYLLELEDSLNKNILSLKTKAIAICKLGHNNSKIIYDSLKNLLNIPWEELGPPQTLVIPGKLTGAEKESIEGMWSKNGLQIELFKRKSRIVVTGTFDVLHPGHLAFFQNAKKFLIPSELCVVVARNSSVSNFKKRAPILDELVRLKMIKALQIVDNAVLGNEGKDKIKIIEELNPDLIVLGYDQWIDEEKLKSELINRGLINTKVVRLEKYGSDGYSSSSEIRKKIATSFMKDSF